MGEPGPGLGMRLREVGEGAWRAAELAVVVTAVCALGAWLLTVAARRPFGVAIVLVCGLVGGVMVVAAYVRNPTLRPASPRRRRRLAQAREDELRDPAARARQQAEARQGRTIISPNGVTSAAGVLVVVLGFVLEAIFGHGR